MTSPHLTTDQKQAIPADVVEAAKGALEAYCCDQRTPFADAMRVPEQSFLDAVARAILAERQKHDLPASPDLQAEAERVSADVQRAVLVEDAKHVIAKALQARDERAAQIADGQKAHCLKRAADQDTHARETYWRGCADTASTIASAIRAGA